MYYFKSEKKKKKIFVQVRFSEAVNIAPLKRNSKLKAEAGPSYQRGSDDPGRHSNLSIQLPACKTYASRSPGT